MDGVFKAGMPNDAENMFQVLLEEKCVSLNVVVYVGFMCIKANISLRIIIYIYCQLIRNLKGHTQKE